jgi:MoaA/NifB/PqqE/SkfB family radical SAM enzyme
MVVMQDNAVFVEDVVSVADFLGARKVKLLSPIAKGRGHDKVDSALSEQETMALHARLRDAKRVRGWQCRISVTLWTKIGQGHALLVHPNGDMVASPVWSEPAGILHIGNILQRDMTDLWREYPYKNEHLGKYLETRMLTI